MRNIAGFEMRPGTGAGANTLYCGRKLGTREIPGSDGRCGPNNGPQCDACMIVAPKQPLYSMNSPFCETTLLRHNADLLDQTKQSDQGDEISVPVELILMPIELAKHYIYCSTGSLNSLSVLLNILDNSVGA